MDVYSVINESKKSKVLSDDEIDRIFSLGNEGILLKIVAGDKDEGLEAKFATVILKNRGEYWENKHADTMDDFSKELNKELKKKVKKANKAKDLLFDKMNKMAADGIGLAINVSDSPNLVFFRLFMNEYNNKYAFTWKAFKEVKREYEKSHPVVGEDIYTLKQLLEKDPKIVKVVDSTVFCKAQNTLSKSILDEIKEKLG